jgi:golgin subfamily A protein 1
MFQQLKQKLAKETGQDVSQLLATSGNRSARSSLTNNQSLDSLKDELSSIEERDSEIAILRKELASAQARINDLEADKKNLQVTKELLKEEADEIQNAQFNEIEKLKSLLLFREQESLDQLNKSRSDENQIEGLKHEIARISNIEEEFSNLQVRSRSVTHICIVHFPFMEAVNCLQKSALLTGASTLFV